VTILTEPRRILKQDLRFSQIFQNSCQGKYLDLRDIEYLRNGEYSTEKNVVTHRDQAAGVAM
jgi:hypothetical protein